MKYLDLVALLATLITTGVYADDALKGTAKCTVLEGVQGDTSMFGINQSPAPGETVTLNRNIGAITELNFSGGGTIPLKTLGARLIKRPNARKELVHFEGVATSRTSDYTGLLTISQPIEGKSYAKVQVLRKSFSGFTSPNLSLFSIGLECIEN